MAITGWITILFRPVIILMDRDESKDLLTTKLNANEFAGSQNVPLRLVNREKAGSSRRSVASKSTPETS